MINGLFYQREILAPILYLFYEEIQAANPNVKLGLSKTKLQHIHVQFFVMGKKDGYAIFRNVNGHQIYLIYTQ